MASARETILLRIETVLAAISIATSYNENIGHVYTDAQILEEIPMQNLPAMVILTGDEIREPFAIGTAANNMLATCPILIGGILFHRTGVTQSQMENLILDSNKALLGDTTLAGLCLLIVPGKVSTNMDAAPGFATFEQDWEIQYLYTRSTGG